MVNSDGMDLSMDTKRLETLVDGIFAIAMTLLVLSLVVPQINGPLSNQAIENTLYQLLPNLTAVVMSFLLLAIFWNIHHRTFKHIKYVNGTILWSNIIFLLFIVLVPFSSSLVGDYGDYSISHIIFNLNLLGIALFLYLNWFFAEKSEFIHEKVDKSHIIMIKRVNALFIIIALCALTLSIVIPHWSEWMYLLIIPLEYVIKRFPEKK
ncbi:MAG: DUF1211 domain-containing protein [Methanobacterium sp.]|nr:DUF1211 domain-containing protein [Methanobacterium sp.]